MAQPFPDFGKWLSYSEAIYSNTAIAHGIDNRPNAAQYKRLVYTYENLYAPLCEHFGFKLPINSFFRSEQLNNVVPGASSTSEHTKGGALDIDMKRSPEKLTNNQLFEYVRKNRVFDQLIFESPDKNNVPGWVHMSIRPTGNRAMVMKMVRTKLGPDYIHWPFKV